MAEKRCSSPLREISDGVFVFLTWVGAWSILDILRVTARMDVMITCFIIGVIGIYVSYKGMFVHSRVDGPAVDLPLLEALSSRGDQKSVA